MGEGAVTGAAVRRRAVPPSFGTVLKFARITKDNLFAIGGRETEEAGGVRQVLSARAGWGRSGKRKAQAVRNRARLRIIDRK
jgi:high-affinity K+ transport system ATPase subunit B